jgi:hypothetical protein
MDNEYDREGVFVLYKVAWRTKNKTLVHLVSKKTWLECGAKLQLANNKPAYEVAFEGSYDEAEAMGRLLNARYG